MPKKLNENFQKVSSLVCNRRSLRAEKTVSATCGLMFFEAALVPEGCLLVQYLYNLPNLEEFVNIFVKNLPKKHVCDIITY